jgi:hypothetical protein
VRGLRTATSFNFKIEPRIPYTPEENKYEETHFHTVSCQDIVNGEVGFVFVAMILVNYLFKSFDPFDSMTAYTIIKQSIQCHVQGNVKNQNQLYKT